jgi:maltooligosyltrehalose trehalohydrolase
VNYGSTSLGALPLEGRKCRFTLWAPRAGSVHLHLVGSDERVVALERGERGYHQAVVDSVAPGALYSFRLDGGPDLPDPASRFQPRGVHGPSQVIDSAFDWRDGEWRGLPLERMVFYEAHVGTVTPEGTFEAMISHLTELSELGVTALSLMPVAQFPGRRNWGYDGVFPFAVQHSYGGPEGLKRLVDACHRAGLAVTLDVVYNHLGPEGNRFASFAPYFTDRYRTPWGPAVNFDGADSDEVRRFFVANALHWFEEFHVDALRLDAVHAILDSSPRPFLQELAEDVGECSRRLGRPLYLVPESSQNDARLIRAPELGGYGLDAQWNDDFHHSLRTLLTREQHGYYQDYGRLEQLAKSLREGFAFSGEPSRFRKRRHGSSSRDIPAERFVVFAQNHDQVGNRRLGERLSEMVCFERLKLAAGVVLLSPFLPLIFMGEEYGERAPFPYFVEHSDPELIDAVREGRRMEFAAFGWEGEPLDPQDESTFRSARLDRSLAAQEPHRTLLGFHRKLLALRRELSTVSRSSKSRLDVKSDECARTLVLRRWETAPSVEQTIVAYHFGEAPARCRIEIPAGLWSKRLDSAEAAWKGPGNDTPELLRSGGEVFVTLPPWSFVLFSSGEGGTCTD